MARNLIALGANLTSRAGGPRDTLSAAIGRLQDAGLDVRAVSTFYQTPAYPAGSGPDYVNAALWAEAGNAPEDARATLDLLHAVEAEFGRERQQRWGARVLDLDLLAVGDLVLPDAATHAVWLALPADQQVGTTPDRMIVPHPRLQDRAFVLVPLADVAPDWRHPVLGETVAQMRDALPPEQLAEVQPLGPCT